MVVIVVSTSGYPPSISCYEVSSPELSHLGFNLPKYHQESSAVIIGHGLCTWKLSLPSVPKVLGGLKPSHKSSALFITYLPWRVKWCRVAVVCRKTKMKLISKMNNSLYDDLNIPLVSLTHEINSRWELMDSINFWYNETGCFYVQAFWQAQILVSRPHTVAKAVN